MAKLSARGRTALARLTKEVEPSEILRNVGVEREQYTVAFMSDRNLLKRTVTWFVPGPYDHGKARRYDYGWKVMGKAKDGVTPESFAAHFEARGYRKEAL